MKIFLLVMLLQVFTFAREPTGGTRRKMIPHFDKLLVTCPDFATNGSMHYRNVKFTQTRNNLIMDFDLDVTKEVRAPVTLNMFIQRCPAKEKLDNCSKFTSIKSDRFCTMIEQKGEVFTPFTECIQPAYKCPFKVRKYLGKNCTFNMDSYTWFPLDNAYWKMTILYVNSRTNQPVYCGDVEGTVKWVNVKNE